MNVVKGILQGLELDTVFAYSTVKVVRIRDRNLGILHYVCTLAILIYILAIVIIKDQGYLEFDKVEGTMRFITQKLNNSMIADLPYCTNAAGTSTTNTALPCLVWDARETRWPVDLTKSIFITTKVQIRDQVRVCAVDAVECVDPWAVVNATEYFVAGVEDFEIRIAHSVIAPTFAAEASNPDKFKGSSLVMSGEIESLTGDRTKIPAGTPDIFRVGTFLDSVGLHLDNTATTSSNETLPPKSFRYEGLTLIIELKYDNTYEISAPAGSIEYHYKPGMLQNSVFQAYQIHTETDTTRRVFLRSGVRLDFVQSGTIGRFKFQTLLIQLVSSIGLLAVATFIIDQIGLRFLPKRSIYMQHKFEYTEDSNMLATKSNLDTVDKELNSLSIQLGTDQKTEEKN